MRKYLAISGNNEIIYYSNYRLGSKANREDMERDKTALQLQGRKRDTE